MSKSVTDEEVSLWYCEICCESGALLLDSHIDLYSVVNALEDAHIEKAPSCDALMGQLRIVRPNDWYRVAGQLAKAAVRSPEKPRKRKAGAQRGKAK